MFGQMWLTLLNASSIFGQYCIAKKIPVTIWIPRHRSLIGQSVLWRILK